MSGIVSYRVDNLEEELSPSKIENLSKDMLEKLDLKTGQIVTTSNEKGKVINNYECYIVASLKSDEARQSNKGDKVYLRLFDKNEIRATIP